MCYIEVSVTLEGGEVAKWLANMPMVFYTPPRVARGIVLRTAFMPVHVDVGGGSSDIPHLGDDACAELVLLREALTTVDVDRDDAAAVARAALAALADVPSIPRADQVSVSVTRRRRDRYS